MSCVVHNIIIYVNIGKINDSKLDIIGVCWENWFRGKWRRLNYVSLDSWRKNKGNVHLNWSAEECFLAEGAESLESSRGLWKLNLSRYLKKRQIHVWKCFVKLTEESLKDVAAVIIRIAVQTWGARWPTPAPVFLCFHLVIAGGGATTWNTAENFHTHQLSSKLPLLKCFGSNGACTFCLALAVLMNATASRKGALFYQSWWLSALSQLSKAMYNIIVAVCLGGTKWPAWYMLITQP